MTIEVNSAEGQQVALQGKTVRSAEVVENPGWGKSSYLVLNFTDGTTLYADAPSVYVVAEPVAST